MAKFRDLSNLQEPNTSAQTDTRKPQAITYEYSFFTDIEPDKKWINKL